MTNKNKISSLSIEQIRKFVTKTLSQSEQVEVDEFLADHPDLKESMEGMNLADLKAMEDINNSVINKLPKSKTKFPIGSVAAIMIVLIGTIWYLNLNEAKVVSQDIAKQKEETSPEPIIDTIVKEIEVELPKDVADVTPDIDTFYTVKKKGKDFEFDIESTAEVKPEINLDPADKTIAENKAKAISQDTKPKVAKQFSFNVELEYRQSIAVESDFASAHKVGGTLAYAGPIAGYEYEEEGMPAYEVDGEDFYDYLKSKLVEDTTLKGISKKMQARVSFEVNNKGRVNNVKIINCNHKQLCMSLSNIFENCPDWSPSSLKGKKGRAHYVIEVGYSK